MNVVIDFGNDGLKVNATIKKDGDQWCVLAGKNLQVGIAGFGSTISEAIDDFKCYVRNH
ncbi:RNA-binding protein [Paraglaciecola Antarctic JLT virus 2]|nr:RNA-binding protein [Paraglaciecola Antarctic JLT virus 2]